MDIAACKIQLSYDNLIIAFDRYEHGEAFSGKLVYGQPRMGRYSDNA